MHRPVSAKAPQYDTVHFCQIHQANAVKGVHSRGWMTMYIFKSVWALLSKGMQRQVGKRKNAGKKSTTCPNFGFEPSAVSGLSMKQRTKNHVNNAIGSNDLLPSCTEGKKQSFTDNDKEKWRTLSASRRLSLALRIEEMIFGRSVNIHIVIILISEQVYSKAGSRVNQSCYKLLFRIHMTIIVLVITRSNIQTLTNVAFIAMPWDVVCYGS